MADLGQSPAEGIPVPAPGEVTRTVLPDSFDAGIRFTVARIVKYISEGRKDPLVITTARKIAALAIGAAEQLGRTVDDESRPLIILEGIHAWGRANFLYLNDPAGIELIQTPNRMLRELGMPEALATVVWEPIRDGMAKAADKDPATLVLPKPRITGDSDEAVCLVLTLAAALDITPMKMWFGGYGGTLHYVWGSAWAAGKWRDVDILMPEFGKHHEFENYEDMEVPL